MLPLIVGLSLLAVPDSGTTVPLKLLYERRATVEVMINGRGPYVLAIETGSPIVIVTKELAEELQLPASASGVSVHGLGGPASMRKIDSLRIGTMVLRDIDVAAGPRLIQGTDGVLGLAAYKDLLLTIDYPGKVVRFDHGSLPDPNGRNIFATVAIGPYFGVEIDVAGHKYPAVLDTQSGSALDIAPAMAESLTWASPLVVSGVVAVGGQAPLPLRSGRSAGDLTLGEYTIQRPVINAHQVPRGFPAEANLGSKFLMNFAVTLDQRNGRVRFVRGDRVIPPASSVYSIGARTNFAPTGPVTIEIFSESGPAYRAGVRTGDEVVKINGRPAADFRWPETAGMVVQTGAPMKFELRREGKAITVVVMPEIVVK